MEAQYLFKYMTVQHKIAGLIKKNTSIVILDFKLHYIKTINYETLSAYQNEIHDKNHVLQLTF